MTLITVIMPAFRHLWPVVLDLSISCRNFQNGFIEGPGVGLSNWRSCGYIGMHGIPSVFHTSKRYQVVKRREVTAPSNFAQQTIAGHRTKLRVGKQSKV